AQGDGAATAAVPAVSAAVAAIVAAACGQAEAHQAGTAQQGGTAGQSGAAGAGSGGDESASDGHDQSYFPEVIIRNRGEPRLTCPRDQAAGPTAPMAEPRWAMAFCASARSEVR